MSLLSKTSLLSPTKDYGGDIILGILRISEKFKDISGVNLDHFFLNLRTIKGFVDPWEVGNPLTH